ncbi:MAG: signal peptidase I [Candidatus Rifleibacteriota bacterium]
MLKKILKQFWRDWAVPFLVVLSILAPIRSVLADYNYIPSGSMKPTLLVGDNVLVNKLAYDLKVPFTRYHIAEWADPVSGEVVVFHQPSENMLMVKRVVGVPGDTVEMKDNRLFINGKLLEYQPETPEKDLMSAEQRFCVFGREKLGPVWHSFMEMPFSPSIQTFPAIKIPDGKYFLMGDNRDNSKDSRFWGLIDRGDILGRAEMILWSKPIWEIAWPLVSRFFKKIV